MTEIAPLAQFMRYFTAVFLLAIACYFQVLIDHDEEVHGEPEKNPIPFVFRWTPFVLGMLILDRAREASFLPGEPEAYTIAIYMAFVWMIYNGFKILLWHYNLPPPSERVPEFYREAGAELRTLLKKFPPW
jgi:IS4 transposase